MSVTAEPPVVRVEGLGLALDTGEPVIEDVSFQIAPGEILGVVGESGAGKSLTGAAIIGLLEPPGRIAGGQILFDGERIDGLRDETMRRIRGRQMIAAPVSDLPAPDSPTTPSTSPPSIDSDTPSRARSVPRRVGNSTVRSTILRSDISAALDSAHRATSRPAD